MKAATLESLRTQARNLPVREGQVWEHVGSISLVDPTKRLRSLGTRIRIVQVAGRGRARTTRYVKVDPPRGGNGRYDHQSHAIDAMTLVRAWALVSRGA